MTNYRVPKIRPLGKAWSPKKSMAGYSVIKLDNRYSYCTEFQYLVEFNRSFSSTGVLEFDRARRWMNQTWGWGQDVEVREQIQRYNRWTNQTADSEDINPHWAYSVKYNQYRIYLKSDSELSWFTLAHPNKNP